jgi:PAS domain S-box-containing protein
MDRISLKLEPLIKHFAEIHRYSEDLYWIAYQDFKYAKYISDAFKKNWGYSYEDILKDCKAWDKHIFPADLKNHHPFVEMRKKIKDLGPNARYDEMYRIIRPDGRIRWVLDKGHPLYDEEGELLGIAGVAIDITLIKTYGQLPFTSLPIFPQHNSRQRYYLKNAYHLVYLTLSEAKCAFFLLQGKTAKQTAQLLHLSYRTVEEKLTHMKRKLGVIYRADLCEALIEGDFMASLINE